MRFCLQLVKPPIVGPTGIYLFNERFACGVCQVSPAAPVTLGHLGDKQIKPAYRCERHVLNSNQTLACQPWPKPVLDGTPHHCEAPGCRVPEALYLVPVSLSCNHGVSLPRESIGVASWLCVGHAVLHKLKDWP